MTPSEADIDTLMRIPAFQRFLFRIIETSGLMRSGAADLARADGRRSLCEDILRWCEDALPEHHSSGLPITTSIHALSAVVHESVAKEKPRRGRRSRDDGFDIGDADE